MCFNDSGSGQSYSEVHMSRWFTFRFSSYIDFFSPHWAPLNLSVTNWPTEWSSFDCGSHLNVGGLLLDMWITADLMTVPDAQPHFGHFRYTRPTSVTANVWRIYLRNVHFSGIYWVLICRSTFASWPSSAIQDLQLNFVHRSACLYHGVLNLFMILGAFFYLKWIVQSRELAGKKRVQ